MSQLELTESKTSFSPTIFVDAILPLPIPKLFTYRVPRDLENYVIVGGRIVVPFGRTRILTGIIRTIHQSPPKSYEAKYIIDTLDSTPSINNQQFKFFEWMARYYMCTPGEVLQAALPAGLKIDTTSLVQRNPYFDAEEQVLSIEEQLVLQQLAEDKPIESALLSELVGYKNISKVLKALLEKEAILVIDSIKEKYSPRRKRFIRLHETYVNSEAKLEELFAQLEKKNKQLELVLSYLNAIPIFENPDLNKEGIAQEVLLAQGVSPSSLKSLVSKGVLEQYYKEVSRFASYTHKLKSYELSKAQIKAKDEILTALEETDTVLVHGITGSGKTEIYIDLIKETLNAGHQVLYLLPEIALTGQIVSRLLLVFGDAMGVYHSKFSANERVEVWKKLSAGEINLIVGVRSSVFLPYADLGLIIIDEEHESSFKQYDPAPRYNAKDSALMLANIHNAKTILGTATPALETYYLAKNQKYGYVGINKRYGDSKLPVLATIDLNRAAKTKTMKGNFSIELMDAIKETLANDEQIIIFQNRRGYAPFISCDTCGWVNKCVRCDVSLTFHQYNNELRCHYCGYKIPPPNTCAACGSHTLKTVSFGTEQLEEELKLNLPDVEVKRLDLDTTRGKTAHQRILTDFDSGKTKILVGTQMVAKGLDFANVGLVGIIDLDRMLRFPDFRSNERTFQLAVQVAGRAGRSDKLGKVLIQTFNPSQPILQAILDQNYDDFYQTEIEERRLFSYPPFSRVIKLTVKDRDNQTALNATTQLYQSLVNAFGENIVLGPVTPVIAKIRDRYLRDLYLKLGRDKDVAGIKKELQRQVVNLTTQKEFRKIVVSVDVDPI